ncbi:hypothetical protein [Anaeromyxobacter oryzae]|uniref:Uncharacterized protein n=1 Tax=Anaeromyxobacter oryzae TaxID=2918170 RepID=A0ABM7WV70_9BACT|nr:hypothetical protein [Anaeromyxobacter oryzae]BDG03356.1 hypothetical protein AMOR_23520 [Anaeromyxobacter oryzae]
MKSVLQIAAGIAVGTGLLAIAGANLRPRESVAEPVAPTAVAQTSIVTPASVTTVAPATAAPPPVAAEATTWRAQARPPDAVSPGMLARVARRVADRAPAACAPPPARDAPAASRAPAAPAAAPPCRAGDLIESVEIDWHGSPSSP